MIQVKTSPGVYVVLSVVALPVLFPLPLLQGVDEYINSRIWAAQVPLTIATTWFFAYLYEEITVDKDAIRQRKIGLRGFIERRMGASTIASWDRDSPFVLRSEQGVEMKIRWTLFSRKDQKLLFDTLLKLNL